MKNFKNIGKNKIKSSKGAISLLVAITIFTFMAILAGAFLTVSILRRSQSDSNARIKQVYEADVQRVDEVYREITSNFKNADGRWDSVKKVNTPKLKGTGLIPVYWDENDTLVELNVLSTDEEFDEWYDYDQQKWANAVTKDEDGNITGYFVWIPRFAYKIKSELGNGGDVSGEIEVVFVDMNNQNGGATYKDTYPTTTGDAMDDFVVHPAFVGNVENGGWDKDIEGFWVAKYAAGFQNGTIGETPRTVVNSNLKYTTTNSSQPNNFLGAITANTTSLSYPVFKANTYAYNMISAGDSFVLAKEIKNASIFYGLSNVDSHMEKNSEWGAVAYLTQSKYGVNGSSSNMNEVTINSKNLNNSIYVNNAESGTKGYVYAVTGYGDSNTANDVNASSTKNITGVFDLNGCVWERVAGFYTGGNASTPEYYSLMATSSTSVSSKYLTLYPTSYANCNKYGDSIKETSTSGSDSNSWNSDFSDFVSSGYPVFIRGGRYSYGSSAGVFAFYYTAGSPYDAHGFRAVLIPD